MTGAARRADRIAALADDQCGILTRAQLREIGVSASVTRCNLAARRWQALSRRVVALQTGPLSEEQKAWFAVLDGGSDCVIAGLSALHRYGLQGFPVDRVQTAVPAGGRAARNDHFVRRRSRRLVPDAVHPVRRPPTMRSSVAILDALEHLPLPRRGCALLAAVVQQRLAPSAQLRRLVTGERSLPHHRLYAAVAGDIEGGAHSLLELDFFALARRAGLPPPRAQAVRTDRAGRRRYLDADFGAFTAEIDGALHLRPLQWWEDMFRQNMLVIAGTPMLRFASVGVRLEPEKVIGQLRDAGARWL